MHIYSVSMTDLLVGSKERGEAEKKVKDLLAEIENRDDVILFVDEIHGRSPLVSLVPMGERARLGLQTYSSPPIHSESSIRFQ